YNAGFRNGDKILTVDYKEVENFFKIVPTIVLEEAKTVQVIRDGKLINIALPENLNYTLIRKKDFFTVRIPYIVGDVVKNTAAEKAGLKPGDKVVAVNDSQVIFVDQIKPIVQANKNKNITLTIEQNGVLKKIDITVPETGLLGVVLDGNISKYFQLKHNDYGFFASIPAGISMGFNTLSNYVKQFKLIFSKETKGYESLGGFITMGNLFSGVWDWESFWALTALLSIVLAFMNILPIPALDGGHVLFLLYEMVTGRKPSDKFLEYAQITGIVILFSLIIYANLNDIIRLFTH
ncbi:MAG TPA: site-2 protease family protein, partial [Bacteroidales bacterium]